MSMNTVTYHTNYVAIYQVNQATEEYRVWLRLALPVNFRLVSRQVPRC